IAIFLPRYGVDHFLHPGNWQGAFTQKNMLARIMVLAAMVFYFVRLEKVAWTRWVGLVGAVVLLALSRSITGAIVFCTLMASLPLYRLIRARVTIAIPIAITLAITIAAAVSIVGSSIGNVLQFLNRSPQLTGRTDLWDAVITDIMKRPYLGCGFNAFWQGMS